MLYTIVKKTFCNKIFNTSFEEETILENVTNEEASIKINEIRGIYKSEDTDLEAYDIVKGIFLISISEDFDFTTIFYVKKQ